MQTDNNAAPLNPLPVAVWLLALPIIAMELVVGLAAAGLIGGQSGIGWRQDAVQLLAFSPDLMREMMTRGDYAPEHVLRLISYPLVHLNFTHAAFVVVFLLALGKMVGEVFRPWALIAVFLGAAVAGAMSFTLLPFIHSPLIGGYPAVYGLIGAFTFILWTNLANTDTNQYRAFSLIGALMGIQLIFGLIFGGGWEWIAELSGFFTGFALSFVVSPGGWARVRAKIRER
jgi:membrane associated rhomboid family serine protease